MPRSISILILLLLPIISFSQISYKYGTYTGTGTVRSFNTLGFSPDVLFIKADNATHTGVIVLSNMPAGNAQRLNSRSSGLTTSLVTSLDANGFTLPTSSTTNASGVTYHYIAFDAGSNLVLGSGVGGVSVTGAGFSPEMVWAFTSNTGAVCGPVLGLKAGVNKEVEWHSGDYGNGLWLSSYDADGFTFGGWAGGTCTYYYAMFNANGNNLLISSYTGNATDNNNITGPGFQPDMLFITNGGSTGQPAIKTAKMSGDATLSPNSTALVTDVIQEFNASGFQVGTSNRSNSVQQYAYAAFSGGTMLSLPVTYLYFNAEQINNTVLLKWQTTQEINNKFYYIQKSIDGINYETIGNVKASNSMNYLFEDKHLEHVLVYYRLIQVDNDGKENYSKEISLNSFNDGFNIESVFVNAEGSVDVIFLSDDNLNIPIAAQIFNMNGNQLLIDENLHFSDVVANEIKLGDLNLPNGIYIMSLTHQNGVSNKKFIVKH